MKLPIPSFGKKKPIVNYFLTLTLRDEQIGAYILKEISSELHVIGKCEEPLSQSIEQLQQNELLEILDRVISKAEEALPNNIMTRKTMFGVKQNWVEDNKIKKEYLRKLKHACDELGLQPTGFLVIVEAIIHQLQEEEGAPLTAILVEAGRYHVTLANVRTGKIVETKQAIIVESVAKTVDALLKHFTSATILPARIIIYDGKDTDSLGQEFISHQWSKSLPFLHMPQISPLPHGFDARSIIIGAAEQMGLHISNDISIAGPSEHDISKKEPVDNENHTNQIQTDEKSATPNLTLAQQFQQRLNERLDHSSKESAESDQKEDESDSEETKIVSADNFGFVENQEILSPTRPPQVDIMNTNDNIEPVDETVSPINEQPEENITSLVNHAPHTGNRSKRSNPLQLFKGFRLHIPIKIATVFSSKGMPRWLYILPIILVLFIAAVGWYILNVQAEVNLTLKPKIVESQVAISLSTSSGNDFANNVIAAQDFSVDIDGTTSTNTTGNKDVGTPAKGTVTIYNNDSNSQTVSSGTIITSNNNLSFTLDKDVTVASASGDVFSGTKPGTADVSVTAKDIGSQYNLPSNVTFSITGRNNIAAKNSSAFSGGTKKTVTVVSQSDLSKLLTDLPQSLVDKAKQQLQNKIPSDQTLINDSISGIVSKKSFNHSLNDQASSISLNGTVTFHGLTYKSQDLEELAKLLLKDKYNNNSSLANGSIETSVNNVKESETSNTTANLTLKAGLLPHIDTNSLLQEITGKSLFQATNTLQNVPQIDSSSIQLEPNIPFIPQMLPRFSKHISIKIKSE